MVSLNIAQTCFPDSIRWFPLNMNSMASQSFIFKTLDVSKKNMLHEILLYILNHSFY